MDGISVLPMRDGVSASQFRVPNEPFTGTLLEFLCANFSNVACDVWRTRLLNKEVYHQYNGQYYPITCHANFADYRGQTIYYYRSLADEPVVPFNYEIIFENDRFMVVDKPHFLTVIPGGNYVTETLLSRLKMHSNNPALTPIHRLDRQTAGLVLFCKQQKWRGAYQQLFATQAIHKTYHAIAPYKPTLSFPKKVRLCLVRGEPFYTMQVGAGAPNSETDIALLAISTDRQWAKYLLTPSTGKLHQLRVHLHHLGVAIKNDDFYPQIRHRAPDDFSAPLQLLAKSLAFTDPITGEDYAFYSRQALLLP